MKKYYCRNCQERIKDNNGTWEQVVVNAYIDPVKCKAGPDGHVPR